MHRLENFHYALYSVVHLKQANQTIQQIETEYESNLQIELTTDNKSEHEIQRARPVLKKKNSSKLLNHQRKKQICS